jgi:hypothetical protein
VSDVWPLDVRRRIDGAPRDEIRAFKCLLLMPFENSFDSIAQLLKEIVEEVNEKFRMPLPEINRLDWVTSSNVIQSEIWQEILLADLVFCDITGLNPNVMFELGVSAAWKDKQHVVLIKNRNVAQRSAFDIAPIRYTEYDLAYPGVDQFRAKARRLVEEALIAFPDGLGEALPLQFPLEIDFSNGRDDPRIYTPPFAHRRVMDGCLEFGSLFSYANSWASIGREKIRFFRLSFTAKFSHPSQPAPKIGVALRSHHYFANYGHNISLMGDGSIWITKPNEIADTFYEDERLREPNAIDLQALFDFTAEWTESHYSFSVDGFNYRIPVSDMQKQLDAGLIRFHSARSWMAISRIHLELLDPL